MTTSDTPTSAQDAGAERIEGDDGTWARRFAAARAYLAYSRPSAMQEPLGALISWFRCSDGQALLAALDAADHPPVPQPEPPAAGPSVEAMAEYEQLKDDLERAVSAWAHDQSGPDEQVELKRAGAALDLFVRPFLQPKIASVSAPLDGAVRIVDECLHDCAQWEPECPHARRARNRIAALSAEGAAGDGIKLLTKHEVLTGLAHLQTVLNDPYTDNWTKLTICEQVRQLVTVLPAPPRSEGR